jgi:hypothetical protein
MVEIVPFHSLCLSSSCLLKLVNSSDLGDEIKGGRNESCNEEFKPVSSKATHRSGLSACTVLPVLLDYFLRTTRRLYNLSILNLALR